MTGFLLTAKQKLMLCINKRLYGSDGSDGSERYARGGSCCRRDKRRGRRRAVQRAAGKSPRSGSPLDLSNKRCGASRTAIHI